MLKILKWTYSLGVKQERQRIARALEAELAMWHNIQVANLDMLKNSSNMKASRKERLDFRAAVAINVEDIVQKLFQKTDQHNHSYASIMFPEEENNG